MGHPFYICESGTGRAIPTDKRHKLDEFLQTVLQESQWGQPGFGLTRSSYALRYHNGFLEVVVDHLRRAEQKEVRNLVIFARNQGLNLFVDIGNPGDEMEVEDIERLVGQFN